MADINKLKLMVESIISDDVETATSTLNAYIAEMTKEILGEAKACDESEEITADKKGDHNAEEAHVAVEDCPACQDEEPLSTCCGSSGDEDRGLCGSCNDHCDFEQRCEEHTDA
jgi:hypothetical protein